jgi:ribosomal protein L34
MRDSRRRPIISTRECARPEGFRSTMETMNGPAVTEDAVARKRMREAMKTTSGDGDF